MKTKNFLITESNNVVVAVITASTNDELNEKTKIALEEHFDTDIETEVKLDMEDYLYGREGEFQVNVIIDKDDEDDEELTTIYIQEVVVY